MQKLALSCIMLNIIGPFWHWPLALALLYFNPFTIGRCVSGERGGGRMW